MSLVESEIDGAILSLAARPHPRQFARRDVDEDALVEVAPMKTILLLRRRADVESTIGGGSRKRQIEEEEKDEDEDENISSKKKETRNAGRHDDSLLWFCLSPRQTVKSIQ